VIANQTISKHFSEAVRVMKLESYGEVIEHFKKLTEDPETTAEFLHQFNSNSHEHQSVLD
jgi:predicted ATP-dependent Lon-type protease